MTELLLRCAIVVTLTGDSLSQLVRSGRRRDDAGYTTEAVVMTALLAAAAITIAGIIVAKVVAKANSISL